MGTCDMEKKAIKVNLKEIKEDIQKSLHDLHHIIQFVQNEDSINSYESSYCKECDQDCGRSNAEIYNCMVDKLKHFQQVQQHYDRLQYTKDFLITDLEDIEKLLTICNKKVDAFIN